MTPEIKEAREIAEDMVNGQMHRANIPLLILAKALLSITSGEVGGDVKSFKDVVINTLIINHGYKKEHETDAELAMKDLLAIELNLMAAPPADKNYLTKAIMKANRDWLKDRLLPDEFEELEAMIATTEQGE